MSISLIVMSCFVSLTLASSDQSMRAIAEEHKLKLVEEIRVEHFDPRTPEELLTIADTVVTGRIIDVTPHFTPDEREVVTDYQILVARVIKRDRNLDSAAQPGATRALVVRRKGGTVIEGDIRYSTLTTAFSNHADLVSGEEVVLFLSYDERDKAYYFSGGPFGVGRVRGGEVTMRPEKEGHPARSLGSFDAFVARLQSLVNKAPYPRGARDTARIGMATIGGGGMSLIATAPASIRPPCCHWEAKSATVRSTCSSAAVRHRLWGSWRCSFRSR